MHHNWNRRLLPLILLLTLAAAPLSAAPDLVLTKNGPPEIDAGEVLTYTFRVRNAGTTAATGVILSEAVPENTTWNPAASAPAWRCTGSQPGSRCTLDVGAVPVAVAINGFVFAVDVPVPFPGEVTELSNTASLTDDGATGPDLDPSDNSDGHLVDVIAAPDLVLAKDDGGAGVLAGATLGYTLRVSNVGTQHAVTVVLDETVPDHTTFNAGASAPGWICNGTAPGSACRLSITPVNVGAPAVAVAFAVDVPSPAPVGVEALLNSAVATNLAENGVPVADLNPADNSATATTPLLAAPDLVLTKTDGGVTVTADEGVVYTLTIANTGNQGATGVKLTERVPANSRFAALVNDPGWGCSGLSAGSVCTLHLGSLSAGAAPRTATFAVRVDSPLAAGVTEIVNDAFIDDDGSGGPDLNPADNRATEATPIDGGVGGTGPDLVVTKSDGGIVVGAGDMVIYAVTVANVGDQHASGVELSETVPANASFVAAASAPGWSCSGTSAGSACTLAVGSVAAGAAPQSFAFAVRIDDPLAAGVTEVANTVVATDDGSGGAEQNPGDNTAREITPIDVGVSTGPDLAVTKSDGGAIVGAGDVLVYALEVANFGNQDATGVLLTENVPAHTTFAAAQSDAAWTCAGISAGSSCSVAVGDLAAGVTRSFAFAVRVDSPVAAGVTELVNSAAVAGAGVDLDPTNNTTTEVTPLDGGVGGTGPNLVVSKSDGGTVASAGDTVVYSLAVENLGNQDASGVELTETVPSHTTFVASASAPGWGCSGVTPGSVCVLSLGSLPVGAPALAASFAVRVDDPLAAGVSQLVNTVLATDDGSGGAEQDPSDNSATEVTPVDVGGTGGPDLVITKSDGGVSVVTGDSIVYTLEVWNDGTRDATGVDVTETVPGRTVFDASASDPRWRCDDTIAGSECGLTLGDVAAGETPQRLAFVVIVEPQQAGGVGPIVNTASVADDGNAGPDLDPSNNDATESTPLNGDPQLAPDLVVLKSDGGVTVGAGESLVYVLEVLNAGTVDARGVVLEETVPEHAMFEAMLSDAGWLCDGETAGSVCELPLGELAAGGTGAVAAFAVTVVDPLPPAARHLINTARAADDGSQGADANPRDNEATVVTPLEGVGGGDPVAIPTLSLWGLLALAAIFGLLALVRLRGSGPWIVDEPEGPEWPEP